MERKYFRIFETLFQNNWEKKKWTLWCTFKIKQIYGIGKVIIMYGVKKLC